MIPVILSGGSGTRLWPLSRELFPKQFLSLSGDDSLFQDTFSRLKCIDLQPAIVICNEEHRFIAAEQLRSLGVSECDIILEPVGRNTAPAIAVAAFHALKNTNENDALLLVLAADHVIDDVAAFHLAIEQAEVLANEGKLVTFGVVPDKAETGYGYIRRGQKIESCGFEVDAFFEKPDLVTVESYLLSGDYLWNSGMFMFKASRYLEELKEFQPEIYSVCEQAVNHIDKSFDYLRLTEDIFSSCPAESIDYAVMESTKSAAVVPLDAGWSDVGSWSALCDINAKDSDGNVLLGDVLTHDVSNSYINASHKLVAAVGVDDVVVVETSDAILVSSKDRVQDVKEIVEQLNKSNRQETISHRQAARPWGDYDCIDKGEHFQVKRLIVKPGAALSLQMHYHRAEHWVVVKGTAKVTRGDEVFTISENESTFIPLGVKHRLENPGVVPLEIIEVQSGSYLGEDDIVRFDDSYGRHKPQL